MHAETRPHTKTPKHMLRKCITCMFLLRKITDYSLVTTWLFSPEGITLKENSGAFDITICNARPPHPTSSR